MKNLRRVSTGHETARIDHRPVNNLALQYALSESSSCMSTGALSTSVIYWQSFLDRMDHQFRPVCRTCDSPMSLMVYCDKNLEFVFECEMCSSEDAVIIVTDIKNADFRKLAKLKEPARKEITVHSATTYDATGK